MIESFDIKENHVYIGSLDKAIEWSGIKGEETNDEQRNNLITHIREKIKNYNWIMLVSCLGRGHLFILVRLESRIFHHKLKRISSHPIWLN